jgi:hypothetical protein
VMTPTNRLGTHRASASLVTVTPAVNGIWSGVQHRARAAKPSVTHCFSMTGRSGWSMSRPRSRGCPAAASRQPPTGTCSYQPLPIGLALLGSQPVPPVGSCSPWPW